MPDLLDDPVSKAELLAAVGEDSKTLGTRVSDLLVAQLLDADIQNPGKLAIRGGLTVQGSSLSGSLPIRALFGARFSTKKLLALTDTTLYEWTGSGAWASVSATFTSDLQTVAFNFTGATNKIVFLNGTDAVKDYDGTTFTTHGNTNTDPPKGNIGIFTSTGRVLIASASGSVGAGNYIYYSSTNPTTLAGAFDRAANNFKIAVPEITGMIEWTSGQVILFGADKIVLMDITNATPTNWTFTTIANDIGCVAPRSVLQYGEDVLFMARDGVRSLAQSAQDKKRGTTLPISDPIKTAYTDAIVGSALSRTVGFSYDGRAFFSISHTAGKLTRVLVYDRRLAAIDPRGGWSIWRMEIESFGELDFSGTNRMYFGSSGVTTNVYALTGTSDNSTAISYDVTTKRYDFGAPNQDKTGDFVEVEAVQAGGTGFLQVFANVDNTGDTNIGTLDLSGGLLTLSFTLPAILKVGGLVRDQYSLTHLGRFRDIAFRLKMDDLDQTVTVNRLTAWAFIENLELGD